MGSFNVRSPYKQLIKSARFKQPLYLARTAWKASAMQSSFVRVYVVANAISRECQQLCRTSPSSSLLRTDFVHKLLEFKWDAVFEELKIHIYDQSFYFVQQLWCMYHYQYINSASLHAS